MTPAEIIEQAAADGVRLSVSPEGNIKASGDRTAVHRWLPLIRQYKPALLVEVELRELRRLVRAVGEFYAFTEAEHASALEVALSDPVAALDHFRTTARKHRLIADRQEAKAC